MAKHPKGKYIKGNVDEGLSLTTLASQTLVAAIFDEVVEERTRINSIRAVWSLAEWTPGAGDGPVLVGVAHSDYSDAEIEEVIESTTSWTEGDLIGQERGRRKVRIIGTFQGPADALAQVVLNDGKPIYTRLMWVLTTGKSLKVWAYNLGASAFATTIPILRVQGHANLRVL